MNAKWASRLALSVVVLVAALPTSATAGPAPGPYSCSAMGNVGGAPTLVSTGLGFTLYGNGSYRLNSRGGRYAFDANSSTLTFIDGPWAGETGSVSVAANGKSVVRFSRKGSSKRSGGITCLVHVPTR